MISRPKGRKGDAQARDDWTARLQKFSSAKNAEERQAVIEDGFRINPGGTLRDFLNAWGYSKSTRGRKRKDEQQTGPRKTARQLLEETLVEIYGAKPSPVPSLYNKLSGKAPTTVMDACRIVTAMIYSWPEPLNIGRAGKKPAAAMKVAGELAEKFVRELLSELSDGRSLEWSEADMKIRVFKLVDEERLRGTQFIKEAGSNEGALIVAGRKTILLGQYPVDTIKEFHQITSQFIDKKSKGILIFVFDSAIFEAGGEGFRLIYNMGVLSSAMIAFALFPESSDLDHPIQHHKVDWSRWRKLSERCCVVIRKPPLIDPTSGKFLKQSGFDEFISEWRPDQNFESLENLDGFVRFDSTHVLPLEYPPGFNDPEVLPETSLYWDVAVRPSATRTNHLNVDYFIPTTQSIDKTNRAQEKDLMADRFSSGRGRPRSTMINIEEDLFYVAKRKSPGTQYDDAQRALYLAARGRLKIDSGDMHHENLNAAAALREIGYEVLPVSVMVSLFPRVLHFAAATKKTQ